MTVAVVNGVRFDSERPCEKHTVTWNGRTFQAGSYLLAALFDFQDWLDRKHPGHYVYVIQGAYNTGVPQSAGTHDRDGCIDALIIHRASGRRVWLRGQRWWRRRHFYAWLRNTGSWLQPSSWHFHNIVVGIQAAGCPVGTFVPGQIADANAGRSGLVGHLADPTWRPKKYTPFPYRAWVRRQEDEMAGPKDWDAADWAQLDKHVEAQVEKAFRKKLSNGLSIRQTVIRIGNKVKIAVPSKGSK